MSFYTRKFTVLIFLSIFFVSSFMLYFVLPVFEKKVKNELAYKISYPYIEFTKNINEFLFKKFKVKSLNDLKKENIREQLEYHLSLLKNKNIKYIFAIYRENNLYKILVDASSSDKSDYGEIFFPTPEEEKHLKEIYKLKKPITIFHQQQKEIKKIGATQLIPLISDNNVLAVVFIDFTEKMMQTFMNFINAIKITLLLIAIIMLVMILITIYVNIKAAYFKKIAYIDELTGVCNRNYLENVLVHINFKDYVVAMFDIDYFKKINDTYGHKIGDQILKDFAKILKSSFRKDEDIIVRYGGEEFLVLIKKDRNNRYLPLNAVARAIKRIRSYPFIFDSTYIKLTASVGIYLDTEKEKSLFEAIKKADAALYRAKLKGRNRIEVYEEGDIYVSVTKINDLIEKRNVLCHYQPIVSLNDPDKILYFEALVRLVNDEGKIIYPNDFMELIKNTYIYAKLTKNVLEFNLKILEKYKDINVSINLSPSDLVNASIIDFILSFNDNIINRIKFEVVETEEMKNYEKVIENLAKIKSRGFEISVDDFGSGYSNFEYLLKLDIDYLKIDANLIKNINKNKKSQELVKSIVLFAKNNNIGTIAEYIENEEILKIVKDIGVEYGQGYYLSKPKPIEDFMEVKT